MSTGRAMRAEPGTGPARCLSMQHGSGSRLAVRILSAVLVAAGLVALSAPLARSTSVDAGPRSAPVAAVKLFHAATSPTRQQALAATGRHAAAVDPLVLLAVLVVFGWSICRTRRRQTSLLAAEPTRTARNRGPPAAR